MTENINAQPDVVRVDPMIYKAAVFQYMGRTRLIAVGSGTRSRYQFDGYGSRVIVDGRDVASLAAIPMLMRV